MIPIEIKVTKDVYDAHRSELMGMLTANPNATLVVTTADGVPALRVAVPRPKPDHYYDEEVTPIKRITYNEYRRDVGGALTRMVGFRSQALEVLDDSKTKVLFRVTMTTETFDD